MFGTLIENHSKTEKPKNLRKETITFWKEMISPKNLPLEYHIFEGKTEPSINYKGLWSMNGELCITGLLFNTATVNSGVCERLEKNFTDPPYQTKTMEE